MPAAENASEAGRDRHVPATTVPAMWTGFYAGINGGGGWGEQVLEYSPTTFTGVTPGGGFGGGQIGYNWQGALGGGNTVFGIEADFRGGDIYNQLIDAAGNSFKSELDYFGTVRARLGYASDRSLYYVTGGLAYGGLKNQAEIGGTNYSTSPVAVGYVAGAGVEMKTGRNWSMKVEYQYMNLGANDPLPAGSSKAADDDYQTVRLGLNYHVGPSYEPLK